MNNLKSSNPAVQIVDVCRRLYEKGYIVATSGNVSVRTQDGFLITPRSRRKDSLTAESMVPCSPSGIPKDPYVKPSSDVLIHSFVYEARPDVKAVVHAHPRFCLACSLANISLDEMFLAEQVSSLGPTCTVPFVVPGTGEIVEVLKDLLPKYNSFIIERHGVLVLGDNSECAYNRLEHLERVASIVYLARATGDVKPFNEDELKKI